MPEVAGRLFMREKNDAKPLGRNRITSSKMSPFTNNLTGPAVMPVARSISGREVRRAAPKMGPYQILVPPTILYINNWTAAKKPNSPGAMI